MAAIWKQPINLEVFSQFNQNTMAETLGIQVTEIGDDFVKAIMPVGPATVQPFRILHGGASVALSETLGSMAGTLCVEDLSKHTIVGVEINANHLKSVPEGSVVTGTCRPVRLGRQIQVWETQIHDQASALVCVSRLTVMVVARR